MYLGASEYPTSPTLKFGLNLSHDLNGLTERKTLLFKHHNCQRKKRQVGLNEVKVCLE